MGLSSCRGGQANDPVSLPEAHRGRQSVHRCLGQIETRPDFLVMARLDRAIRSGKSLRPRAQIRAGSLFFVSWTGCAATGGPVKPGHDEGVGRRLRQAGP